MVEASTDASSTDAITDGLCYVLSNARRHGLALAGLDPYSSARWFDGWRGIDGPRPDEYGPIAAARTWLARVGWRRHGRIDPAAVPGGTSKGDVPHVHWSALRFAPA
jgi:putative transposase